jgi:hypothetical protein
MEQNMEERGRGTPYGLSFGTSDYDLSSKFRTHISLTLAVMKQEGKRLSRGSIICQT